MNLPYQPDAKSCYSDVRKVPLLGEAVDKMIEELQSRAPFDARWKAILDLRMRAIERYRERPLHDGALKEESAYVCAGNDLLLAAFMREIERISTLPQTDRATPLQNVTAILEKTELNPSWNTYLRPRIATRIAEIQSGH